jgi:hypothetical protein
MEFTQTQLEKAVADYAKRKEYNRQWRERNPLKVKAMRREYNKRKYADQKAALAVAKSLGLI